MRRIKHFAGYGCVKAGVVVKTKNYLEILVRGEHEYGLVREDKMDVFDWLVKRFDKTHTDWIDIIDLKIDNEYVSNPKCYTGYEEIAVYKIRFRDIDN